MVRNGACGSTVPRRYPVSAARTVLKKEIHRALDPCLNPSLAFVFHDRTAYRGRHLPLAADNRVGVDPCGYLGGLRAEPIQDGPENRECNGALSGVTTGHNTGDEEMSYVDDNLISGESVQARAHISPLLFVPGIVLTIVLFLVWHPLVIFGLILLLTELITFLTTEFAITNKRVVGKVGLIRRATLELDLSKVESLGMDQGILGRILGYGVAKVRGTGGTTFAAPGIASPNQFKRSAFEQIDAAKQAAAVAR